MKRSINCIKKSAIWLLVLVLVSSYLSTDVLAFPRKSMGFRKQHSFGVKPFSEEDNVWMKKNMTRTSKIRPNRIGLFRTNELRKKMGLREININKATDIGEEILEDKLPEITKLYSALAPISVTDSVYDSDDMSQYELPPYVDNSSLPYFPPIRNQGSQGSCVAFSTTYYQATHMIAMANDWDTKNNDNTNKFSPKWTYNLTNNGNDNGSNQINAYRLFVEQGIATWSDVPYDENYLEWPSESNIWQNAAKYKPDRVGYLQVWDGTYTPVTNESDETLKSIKQLLSNGYVLSFNTSMSNWVYKPILDNTSTDNENNLVGRAACYMRNTNNSNDVGHTLTIVGYCDDVWVDINNNMVIDEGEKGAFKIANSWGSNWGIDPYTQNTTYGDGFIWLCYDALNKVSSVTGAPPGHTERLPAIDDENTAYWMSVKPVIQPYLLAEITVSHSKRNQLNYEIGYSLVDQTSPTIVWTPYVLNRNTGECSFDGTNLYSTGTIVLDYTNLILKNNLMSAGVKWYVRVTDTTSDGNHGVIHNIKLIEPGTDIETFCPIPGNNIIDGSTLTVCAFGSLTPQDQADSSLWEHKKDINHNIKYGGQSIVSSDGKIYLYANNKDNSRILLEYEPFNDQWNVYDDNFSLYTTQAEAVSTGGKIFFFLPGYTESYDLASKSWNFHTTTVQSMSNTSVVECGQYIYSIGGNDSAGLSCRTITGFNPQDRSWTPTLANMQYARKGSATAVLNGKIYIFGGTNEDNVLVKQVEEYDPEFNTVKNAGVLPDSISNSNNLKFKAITLNGKVYLFASDYNASYVYEYTPDGNWTYKSSIPGLPSKFGVQEVLGKIYLIPSESQNVLEFDPCSKEIFLDGLESGDFEANGWTAAGNSSVLDVYYSGKYSANLMQNSYIEKAFNLKGFKNIEITFSYYLSVYPETDALTVEWFDGYEWHNLEDITHSSGVLTVKSIRLPGNANNNPYFKIRFATKFDDIYDKVFVDDIKLKAVEIIVD